MNETDLRRLDLNLLYTLYVLLDESSVTRTATRLGLSQSAVSHALGRLREFFDDPLLVRTATGMVLSSKAVALQGRLGDTLEDVGDLIRAKPFDPATEAGTFRLAASDYGMILLFPRLIERISLAAPHLKLDCVLFSAHVLDDLENGFIDLVFGGYKPYEGFCHEVLFDDRLVGVVRTGHPLLDTEISAQDLLRWPHAFIEIATKTWRDNALYQALEKMGFTGEFQVKTPHFMLTPTLIQYSDLILVMPEKGALHAAERDQVTVFELPVEMASYPFFQTWHSRRTADSLHQWMRAQILATGLDL